MDDAQQFYWVVLTPSASETVAYIDSDIAPTVAATVTSDSYLAVLVVNSDWTPESRVAAYLVQPRSSSEELESHHPIHPSTLESREPIIPPLSFAAFGDCVLDTSRRALFQGVYTGALDSRNLIPMEYLGSFPTQRWIDMELELKRGEEKIKRDQADDDNSSVLTTRSTDAVPQPHEIDAPTDIQVFVSFDLSVVRELVPASKFFEQELEIKRFRAFHSREGTEGIFSWVQQQTAHVYPAGEFLEDTTVEDLSHPALVALASSMENPYDLVEESSEDEEDWDLYYWEDPCPPWIRVPRLEGIDPHSFGVIYFDVFGTLIDNETGIWVALQPLLQRSCKGLSRFEALSLYFELEQEVKQRELSGEPLLLQSYQEFALRLGLTWTSAESSAFVSSIASWPLLPGALDCLQKLRPHFTLVALLDMDAQTISSATAFDVLHPYFHETRMPGFPIPEVDKTSRCIVSSSLVRGIEPARRADVPGVWLRLPGSLSAGVPAMCSQSYIPWRLGDGFQGVVDVLSGKMPDVKCDESQFFELTRVDSGYSSGD
ncbi:hypothetical protein FB45DRAFT_139716 [Roridomyces roridus]|uniref:Uncharacterized protein n=1 Tax=Roridomyces roridus TaxID=1738132 RepID=A0AAD7BI43_9AGAR|nr:hypothetical protein FB45DRAFT_139716 [Roridomyces roridus]